MSNWDNLSMREKAAYIKVGVLNGLTSISDIKEYYDKFLDIDSEKFNHHNNNYNDTVNKFDEGGEKDVTNNLNLLDKALLGISSAIMELGRTGNIRVKTKGGRGAALYTYLLPRNLQKKVFLDAGYIEGDPGDYGLVKKAVGNRNIPVYQTAPDTVSREDLIVLGNPKRSELCYYPTNNALYHAGSYPSALYMDTNYNIYRKSWDLNDYGNTTGTAGTTYGNKQWKANLIDKIGSPVVVTTGFLPVMDNIHGGEQINLIDLFNRKDPHAMKYIELQKLYPLYEDIPIYYNNEPILKHDGSPMTYTDVTMFSNAPEIIVTPKGNYVYNSYDNITNKLGGGSWLNSQESGKTVNEKNKATDIGYTPFSYNNKMIYGDITTIDEGLIPFFYENQVLYRNNNDNTYYADNKGTIPVKDKDNNMLYAYYNLHIKNLSNRDIIKFYTNRYRNTQNKWMAASKPLEYNTRSPKIEVTKGKSSGVLVPTAMIDSIVSHTKAHNYTVNKEAGLVDDPYTALAVASIETDFGKHLNHGELVKQSGLTPAVFNDERYYLPDQSYYAGLSTALRNYYNELSKTQKMEDKQENFVKHYLDLKNLFNDPKAVEYVGNALKKDLIYKRFKNYTMQDLLPPPNVYDHILKEIYSGKYNSGNANYNSNVRKNAEILRSDPNVKRYVQKAVKKYDIGGLIGNNMINKSDDNGLVIPLSRRDDFSNPSVRYRTGGKINKFDEGGKTDYNYIEISKVNPEYAAKEVKDASGNILSWDQVLKHYPDYKIAVDEEGRPIDNSTRKNTPALDYHRLVKITENDPNGPYAATKWLLGQLAMLPISAIGAVTVPVSATVGGLVGSVGGDVLGHYVSDWMFDNPDKEYNLFNSGITITPRLASRLVGGLAGGLLGGYSGYAATEKAVKPYLISREIKRMPLTGSNELPNNVGWGPKQTITVSHKSNSPEPLVLLNPERYDIVKEGANPLGIWYLGKLGVPRTVNTGSTLEKATKAQRARELFDNRLFTHKGDLTLEKPLVTIGEVPNRSTLSYQAEQLGADGIIYNGVYDNGYDNNLVILSFKLPDFDDVKIQFKKLNYPINELKLYVPDQINSADQYRLTRFWNDIFLTKYNANRLKLRDTSIDESIPGEFYSIKSTDPLAIKGAAGHSHKESAYIYSDINKYNKDETIIHEGSHNFRDTKPNTLEESINNLGKDINKRNFIDNSKYTSEEIDALDNAYTFTSDFPYNKIHESYLDRLAEKSATNTLLQYAIWKLSKARNISELNAAIDKLSDDDILYMLLLTNGYGDDFVKYIASNPNTKSQAVSNIREALKYVPVATGAIGYGGYELHENLTNNNKSQETVKNK